MTFSWHEHSCFDVLGFTRRAIGSAFEGETKEEDGQVWADVEIEGIDSEVIASTEFHLELR